MINYRNDAIVSLERAKTELSSGDNNRLKYAMLELRLAMESLIYDRAAAYKQELPESEYATWQPRKLMSVLLEIDPHADKDSSIAAGLEKEYGVQAENMKYIGSEKVLKMGEIRKNYDMLRYHLHVPSLKQMTDGKTTDYEHIRQRCEELVSTIDKALSSTVFNAIFKVGS